MRIIQEDTFLSKLKNLNISITQACDLVNMKTGAVISPSHVRTQLRNYGRLTEPQCATFGFLFRELETLYNVG